MTAERPKPRARRKKVPRRASGKLAPPGSGGTDAPPPAQVILQLQRDAGNRSVANLLDPQDQAAAAGTQQIPDALSPARLPSDPVVARAPSFVPTFGGAAGVLHLENLNADVKLAVPVKNAKRAPAGTAMVWSWGVAATDGVERGDISPATGPSATFNAKAKKPTPGNAKDELAANLEVGEPGAAAVVHPVKPAMRVAVLEPSYTIDPVVVPGATGGGTATALKPSDTLELHITFSNLDKPGQLPSHVSSTLAQDGLHLAKLHGVEIPDDQPFQRRPSRWEGDKLILSLYCHHAGTATCTIDFALPGAKPHQEKISLKAAAGLEFFLKRCDAASDRHRALLATIDAYIQQGWLNYKAGHDAAAAAFKEYADRVQLTKDLLLGILFAGVGGAAGGYVGGLVKFKAEQKWFADIAKSAIGQASIGAVTDAPKDMVKYLARMPTKLGKGGGSKAPAPDDATPDHASGGASKGVPGAIDPLDWYGSVQKAASIEEAKVATQLQLMKTAAIDAIAQGSTETVDFDPVNMMTEVTAMNGKTVVQLGEPPSADAYEKNMWEAWIEKYAYTLEHRTGCNQWGMRVEDNVGKELRNEMERVEKALAEKGIEAGWVSETLTKARRIADAKAAESRRLF